jgi:RNA polymerase sigma factor (sigma-70 family)
MERTLTQESFSALLVHFDPNPQRAVEKYEVMRLQLITFFSCRGCASACDLTDTTIDRVARRILEGENIPSAALASYFYGVARNVLREYFRHPDTQHTSIDDVDFHEHPSEQSREARLRLNDKLSLEQKLECLEDCLEELPLEMQGVIVSYYEGEESIKINNRQELAASLGISAGNLRIRVHRARAKLEKCITGCLERLQASETELLN